MYPSRHHPSKLSSSPSPIKSHSSLMASPGLTIKSLDHHSITSPGPSIRSFTQHSSSSPGHFVSSSPGHLFSSSPGQLVTSPLASISTSSGSGCSPSMGILAATTTGTVVVHHTPVKSRDLGEDMEAIRLSRQDNPYLQVRI